MTAYSLDALDPGAAPDGSFGRHQDAFLRARLSVRYRFRRYVRGPWSVARPDVQ